MAKRPSNAVACHNCRRQRLKCDRSLPCCSKCVRRGQQCLGYQKLFRWEQGIASRGKLVGVTSSQLLCAKADAPIPKGPADPLIQDLSCSSRKYLLYFATDVCKDLVLYDDAQHNAFRELIPWTQQYPVLLHIMVANSALRMANASHTFLALDRTHAFTFQHTKIYGDALAAKQRAFQMLRGSIANIDKADVDATLAAVLLFTEFELIDSGRDTWRHHVKGAKAIIERLCQFDSSIPMSTLRSCMISNLVVFDILGSTLACSDDPTSSNALSNGTLSLLQDAEGNHCSSFPATLLQLIQRGAQLLPSDKFRSSLECAGKTKAQEALILLKTAQSFDPLAWATKVQDRSPATDLQDRAHIAFAHRAAVCIYLSRILFSLDASVDLSPSLQDLAAEVVTHLGYIQPSSALFIAITWPAFIAGAETNDHSVQMWVAKRFEELWKIEPWGLLQGASGVLHNIWAAREKPETLDEQSAVLKKEKEEEDFDWMEDLRKEGIDWLII